MAFLDEKVEREGRFFTFCDDPDNKKPVRFQVRAVPQDVERQIRRRLGLLKMKVVGARHDVDLDKEARARVEVALYAWLGSQNFSVKASTPEGAAAYAAVVPETVLEDGAFPVGRDVVLDDHLTEGLKRHVLDKHPRLALWLEKKAAALFGEAIDEEELLQGE